MSLSICLYLVFALVQIFGSSRQALTDPKGDVERFIQGYNDSLTGDTRNKINFYQGSYDEVSFSKSFIQVFCCLRFFALQEVISECCWCTYIIHIAR